MKYLTRMLLWTVVALFSLAASSKELAQTVVFIANDSVKATDISQSDVRNLFLGKSNAVGTFPALPVVLQKGATHEAFLDILGKSDSAFNATWRMLVFTGKAAMPRSFGTDDAVITYVRATPGAVGYVSANKVPAGVHVLRLN